MSVWKKFQRVGKKAAKYQFTASYTELLLETNDFKPSNIIITWVHRSRKYSSDMFKLVPVPSKPHSFSYVWEVPKNVEMVTTLYKMKKDIKFEEKDWTFQLEDVRDDGTHPRILAYRNMDISQYAEALPTQNNIKISFKLSSKKIKSATLFLTLNAVFLKEGEATDDDMISVASLMSVPSSQNFMYLQNSDIARMSDLDDMNSSIIAENPANVHDQIFSDLVDKIGQLDNSFYSESLSAGERSSRNSGEISNSMGRISLAKDESEPYQKHHTANGKNNPDVVVNGESLNVIVEEDRLSISEMNSTTELLQWCQDVTKGYCDIKITNFTTSFRNGMAFCAIIHHFHPELIDYSSLKPTNVKENNRIAFTAAASLGIPKVLDPNEMSCLKFLDSLSVMTYLHQLRTYFTNSDFVMGNNSPGSYMKQNDGFLPNLPLTDKVDGPSSLETCKVSNSKENQLSDHTTDSSRITMAGDVKVCKENSNPFFEMSNNESKTNPFVDTRANPLTDLSDKTQNSNPFSEHWVYDSKSTDGECITTDERKVETITNAKKEKSPKKSPKKPKLKLSSFNVDGTVKEECSLSEKKIRRVSLGKLNLFSDQESQEADHIPSSKQPNGNSVSPTSSKKNFPVAQENDCYINAEIENLEREQEKIDDEASKLEKELRLAMSSKNKKKESVLFTKWFELVDKKNILIRRNMQLQILLKEQDLERKGSLLQAELRQIISVEDWSKTEDMKHREELLMKDLINIVNQRDSVVHELDKYEKEMVADLELAKSQRESVPGIPYSSKTLANANFSDKNCIVM